MDCDRSTSSSTAAHRTVDGGGEGLESNRTVDGGLDVVGILVHEERILNNRPGTLLLCAI